MFKQKCLRANLVAAASILTAISATAQEVAYTPSPVSGVSAHPFFPLAEINDGITADVAPNYNGFISRTSNLTLEFDLGGTYNMSGMKIWNDVNVREEGIATFEMRFYNGTTQIGSSYTGAGPANGQHAEDDYLFSYANITRIEMDMTAKDAFGIEVREIKLFGYSAMPIATNYSCYDLMDHEMASYRKDVRFEDQFGRSPSTILGQPVSICAPANVDIRNTDVTTLENHLVCYQAIDARTERTLEHRLGVTNALENNVVVTGQLDTICMNSVKEHL